jgi:hypothetical protein
MIRDLSQRRDRVIRCADSEKFEVCGTLEPIDTDEVLAAVESVVRALKENQARTDEALERAAEIQQQRRAGRTYTEIFEESERPLLVEILTTNVLELHDVGHQLRTSQAHALRREGLSTQRIAQLYGVSRQRIMALLRSTSGADFLRVRESRR